MTLDRCQVSEARGVLTSDRCQVSEVIRIEQGHALEVTEWQTQLRCHWPSITGHWSKINGHSHRSRVLVIDQRVRGSGGQEDLSVVQFASFFCAFMSLPVACSACLMDRSAQTTQRVSWTALPRQLSVSHGPLCPDNSACLMDRSAQTTQRVSWTALPRQLSVSRGPLCPDNLVCCHSEIGKITPGIISRSHSTLTPEQPGPALTHHRQA